MATVVLTAVGSVFGPIGAAVGVIAGRVIDGAIFKPAGRVGPRIADLRVQTSSFGTQIPRMFGRMRVAGTVIWATDLMESTETTGGGKGKPSVTSYVYTASFAVALSSRPIVGIGRIWADGNLLRGEAGDFKTGLGAFRVHDGGADQPVDALIAADRGMDLSPAHRDMAYVVFEGLQLADFGNRIPSLTFEVIADEDGVPVASIAAALTHDVATPFAGEGDAPILGGYAASGDSAGDAIQPILDAYALSLRPVAEAIALTRAIPLDRLMRVEDDLAFARGDALPGRTVERKPVEAVTRRLSVRHYDPARDYQAGIQSAERQGTGWEEMQIDLPATLEAVDARQRAEELLRRQIAGRRTVTLARGWDALALGPGDVVALEGQGGGWRVETTEWEGMAVKIGLTAVPTRPIAAPLTDSGIALRPPDRLIGPTHVTMVETPQLYDRLVDVPQLFVAASGESGGWKGSAILLRDEAGAYVPIGSVRRSAAMGVALDALPAGESRLYDNRSTVEVQLYDADAILTGVSDAALLNGANVCMIGEELLQYGMATPIGPRRYRLGRLLRGRRGTENGMQGHAEGDGFVLLEADRLLSVGDGNAVTGRASEVAAQGPADATPVHAVRTVVGRAMVPPSPVHLRIQGSAAAGLSLSWTRRSRLGWAWGDGADAPLAEEQEAYLVEIWSAETLLRSATPSEPYWTYSSAQMETDFGGRFPASPVITVRQRGTHGLGPAARILFSL